MARNRRRAYQVRVDGPVPAVAELLASYRWSAFSSAPLIDPNLSQGKVSAQISRSSDQRELNQGRRRPNASPADLGLLFRPPPPPPGKKSPGEHQT